MRREVEVVDADIGDLLGRGTNKEREHVGGGHGDCVTVWL